MSLSKHLRRGGWAALSEVDDLFGHEPLGPRARAMFDAYARGSLETGRYDFHMGHKLRRQLERAGFTVSKELTLDDQELSFQGVAPPEVIDAWRTRFDRMHLLREFCGAEFEAARDEFLGCLARDDHHSRAKVWCCIATK